MKAVYLKDYKAPDYRIDTVDLHFDIRDAFTRVTSLCHFRKQTKSAEVVPLALDGEDLKFISVQLNGVPLESSQFDLTPTKFILKNPPSEFDLKIVTEIEPDKNTSLQGLYRSGNILCTQNEAEGFRHITYFLDRPDVMAVYTTTIEADKTRYPILLANGNLVAKEDLEEGRHRVRWHDPFPKPCYLFALVAGQLGRIDDFYVTRSGRRVKLEIYVDPGDEDRAVFAMQSLKKAMKWDEDVYGLEYDLDIYMITAVHSFNMGAMENKGLNIFNSRLVLASTETSTDDEFEDVQAVIGHEYFHNWTGNRVTCRDWFQLSLKEGLTVFRDQEFTADMTSRAVKRIDDVNRLRTFQFAEDSGPMAHPVRPDSYIEINNFYTVTVYEKGAEVIRMIHTLVGPEAFRRGMDKYFELYDGQAVTTEDFVHAMELASGMDLAQFKRWYDQAGTPEISFEATYDLERETFTLSLSQFCPPTPGQTEKKPFHIPIAVGLLDSKGRELPLQLENDQEKPTTTKVLQLREEKQSFTFTDIKEKARLSLLRDFSAPVKVKTEIPEDDLLFLMTHDTNSFVRWEAAQSLALKNWHGLLQQMKAKQELSISKSYVNSYGAVLEDSSIDPAFKARLLMLPSPGYFMQTVDEIDPDNIDLAREFMVTELVKAHKDCIKDLYGSLMGANNTLHDSTFVGQRALSHVLLSLLRRDSTFDIDEVAYTQFENAQNMTTRLNALEVLSHQTSGQRDRALQKFYERFKNNTLVVDQWLTIQATSRREDTLARVKELANHPAFDLRIPNKCYSLLYRFAYNTLRFNDPSGAAYEYYADQVLKIDALNPQVAARLASAFNQWKRFEPRRREAMKAQLERMLKSQLSKNTFEIVSKALEATI